MNYLKQSEKEILTDITKAFDVTFSNDQANDMLTVETIEDALKKLEKFFKMTIIIHDNIKDYMTAYLSEKYKIREQDVLFTFIDTLDYFNTYYVDLQTSQFFRIGDTNRYIEVTI